MLSISGRTLSLIDWIEGTVVFHFVPSHWTKYRRDNCGRRRSDGGGCYGDEAWLTREMDAAGDAGVDVGFITWSLARRPTPLDMMLERRPPAVMLSFGDVRPHAQKIKQAGALLTCQVQTLEQLSPAGDRGQPAPDQPNDGKLTPGQPAAGTSVGTNIFGTGSGGRKTYQSEKPTSALNLLS